MRRYEFVFQVRGKVRRIVFESENMRTAMDEFCENYPKVKIITKITDLGAA